MATLTNLPNELLHYICDYTQFGESAPPTDHGQTVELNNTALLQLSRSCRVLRIVAQDILYRAVSQRVGTEGSLLPLWRLTETILTRPRLADKVKTLSVQVNPQASIQLSAKEDKLFSGIHQPLTTPHLLQDGSREIWAYEILYALLSHLPSVETLYFEVVDYDLGAGHGRTSAEVLDRLQTLHHLQATGQPIKYAHGKLRTLEIVHDKTLAYMPLTHVGEIEVAFLLASLESVSIRRQHSVSLPGAPLLPPWIASNLTNLELREYCVNLTSLSYLFKVACNLKRFTFVILEPTILHRGTLLGRPELDLGPLTCPPTPTQVLDALNCRSSTLEYLELDFYDWYQPGFEALWGHDGTNPKQRYPTFRQFKILQVLNIEHERLSPPQELPGTLVALILTHKPPKPCLMDDPLHYPRIERSYRKLIQENICPRLQYVRVGRFYPFRYVGARLFEWRHINEKKWADFVSNAIDFDDPDYVFEDESVRKSEGEMIHQTWWDPWWQTWLADRWPKELKEDLMQRLLREATI